MAARETATLGGGCFWCLEAVFDEVRGVTDVVSGYTGGGGTNPPTYEQVCSGRTGHAEVVQVEFDPAEIAFREILEIFFAIHDPTTLNRQGNDVGTQYRSAIFYHSEEQRRIAREVIAGIGRGQTIVTEVAPAPVFYPAESYHQDYYKNHPEQGYCAFVVGPKVSKFRKTFADRRRAV